MTTTITRVSDSATTTPDLVLGYETSRQSRNIVHELIGGGISITLVPASPRSGALQLFYIAEADAWASMALHATADSFTLADTDIPDVGMTYVLSGSVDIALDEQTRAQWVVTVNYQEIEP